MDRTEENRELIKTICDVQKENNDGGIYERVFRQMLVQTAYIADISQSLALIADNLNKGSEAN